LNLFFLAAVLHIATATQPFPTHAGTCGWVHGRFSLYNGSSIQRIWVIGTHHMVALRDVYQPPNVEQDYPPAMAKITSASGYRPFDDKIYGDFRICALERWIPGHLQHVRIAAARKLIVVSR
jgi:hypothetical protein